MDTIELSDVSSWVNKCFCRFQKEWTNIYDVKNPSQQFDKKNSENLVVIQYLSRRDKSDFCRDK